MVERYRGTDELIARFKATGKVNIRALLREIAIAKLYHLDFGDGRPDALIRFDLLDIIASKLTTPAKWAKEENEIRQKRDAPRYTEWQEEADNIWRVNKMLLKTPVAKMVAKCIGGNWNTIRRIIKKK
jgi:hypothetical protein